MHRRAQAFESGTAKLKLKTYQYPLTYKIKRFKRLYSLCIAQSATPIRTPMIVWIITTCTHSSGATQNIGVFLHTHEFYVQNTIPIIFHSIRIYI